MKINRPEIINLLDKIMKQGQVRGKDRPSTPSVNAGDRVELSGGADMLRKILGQWEGIDAARAQKISALARRIEAGQYEVDAQELAACILRAMDQGHSS